VATRVPAPVVVSHIPNPIDLVRSAMQFRGVHYHLGGELPSVGFDCSGFVRYVFSLQQIALPRTVSEQYGLGAKVKTDDVREGDLVFFSTTAHGASHVGLAISHTEFIHAPGSNGVVRIDRLAAPYWHNRIVAVKRLS
jgi:cell wall-associated NlpC family hydrolase